MAESNTRIVAGRYIISLKSHASHKVKARHMGLMKEKTEDSTPFRCDVLHELDMPECRGYAASLDDTSKEEIEQRPEVAAVEPVQLYRHCAIQANAPWGLGRISKPVKVAGNGPYTYSYRDDAAGDGVYAYVIDTGINTDHVEFDKTRTIRGPVFVTPPRPNITTVVDDMQGHGTHCAGTIASRAYGVAKKATVVGVKVFNDLPEEDPAAGATNADIMRALDWVVQHVEDHGKPAVVNLSLGGPPSKALDNYIAATVRKGIVVCVAAGNGSPPQDATTTSPAREPLAVTVGATNIGDEIAYFSFFGKMVDILAPGVDVLSCWIKDEKNPDPKTATATISGTSMACPHVSGVACCVLSDSRILAEDKTPSGVISQILIQADKNKISGLSGRKSRTIDAVLQVNDA